MPMSRVRRRLAFLLAGVLAACQQPPVRHESSVAPLEVVHTPLRLEDVPEGLRKTLEDRLGHAHVRFYRTDVKNNTDRVLRIVWFDAMFRVDDQWYASNIRNRVLRTRNFMDWHTRDAMTADGWLLPGGTATCKVNWDWSEDAEARPTKWAYIAVDSQGRDYFVEAPVPDMRPERVGNPVKG